MPKKSIAHLIARSTQARANGAVKKVQTCLKELAEFCDTRDGTDGRDAYIKTLQWLIDRNPDKTQKILETIQSDSNNPQTIENAYLAQFDLAYRLLEKETGDALETAFQIAEYVQRHGKDNPKVKKLAEQIMLLVAEDSLKFGLPGAKAADKIICFILKQTEDFEVLGRARYVGRRTTKAYRDEGETKLATALQRAIKAKAPRLSDEFETTRPAIKNSRPSRQVKPEKPQNHPGNEPL